MFSTPLHDELVKGADSARPFASAQYRGVETAVRFGDPQEEFSTLLNGCGVYDSGFSTAIALKGTDRLRWTNGMVTNNIRDLPIGQGVYAFMLNPQGRIMADMRVYNLGDTLEVETDRSQVEKILAAFDHYIIMDDVEVVNLGEQWTALGMAGPKSRSILHAAGIAVPELQPLQFARCQCNCDCGCLNCTVARGDDGRIESYVVWLAPKDVYAAWKAVLAAGATPVGIEALEIQRIVSGIPLYGVDIRERDLPQETEQMRALNFNKGCYVGQEIVERIRSRGNVHRKLSGFAADGAGSFAVGAKVIASDKEVGEVTSAATLRTPSGERTVALGYIRREAGVPGREVQIGTTAASVIQLPMDVFSEKAFVLAEPVRTASS